MEQAEYLLARDSSQSRRGAQDAPVPEKLSRQDVNLVVEQG